MVLVGRRDKAYVYLPTRDGTGQRVSGLGQIRNPLLVWIGMELNRYLVSTIYSRFDMI